MTVQLLGQMQVFSPKGGGLCADIDDLASKFEHVVAGLAPVCAAQVRHQVRGLAPADRIGHALDPTFEYPKMLAYAPMKTV
ncbi:MAG: hypothetical protein WD138_00590, partial [Halofilum sp. (in: g-proteobacteria)]